MVSERQPAKIKLTAGDAAPSLDLFSIDDMHIPDEVGRYAILVPKIESDASGDIAHDPLSEPPVIRFRHAVVALLFGYTGPDNEKVGYTHGAPPRKCIVDGEYSGPGSELFISEVFVE